jgi:hypothetical protein
VIFVRTYIIASQGILIVLAEKLIVVATEQFLLLGYEYIRMVNINN